MNITKTQNSKLKEIDWNNLPFGRVFSDHMFISEYENGSWQNERIIPYGDLSISPALAGLHYGQSIFEGMKALTAKDSNDILLFRPELNAKRFYKSAERMAMPPVPVDMFLNALKELVNLDRNWVPKDGGYSLYIRPFMFAADRYVGIKESDKYIFIIFTCPVGSYYSKPVNVYIESEFVRAASGGVGDAKTAGNYAATLFPLRFAKEKGYDQILWTDAKEHKYVEEIGTMNVFFEIDGRIVTPVLDGTILEGTTRSSVITLLKDMGYKVEERKVLVDELFEAYNKGTLTDAWGTGTAATIAPIGKLGRKNEEIYLPDPAMRKTSNAVKKQLEGIRNGTVADIRNWVEKV